MPRVSVSLPVKLTEAHRRVALKYFEKPDRLSSRERLLALETFDMLAEARLMVGGRRVSFRQFYEDRVDRAFAGDFIAKLLDLELSETEEERLQQETARRILGRLEERGYYRDDVDNSQFLAAYCLYWWIAFARGYRFELAIIRDLRDAGISFHAHDLKKPEERRSPYDLVLQEMLGDIKTTTYFLHLAKKRSLTCDFYITRLYDPRHRRYEAVVLLTEAAWRLWNGEPVSASLETAADYLPSPVRVAIEHRRWVIMSYEIWKHRVGKRQQDGGQK